MGGVGFTVVDEQRLRGGAVGALARETEGASGSRRISDEGSESESCFYGFPGRRGHGAPAVLPSPRRTATGATLVRRGGRWGPQLFSASAGGAHSRSSFRFWGRRSSSSALDSEDFSSKFWPIVHFLQESWHCPLNRDIRFANTNTITSRTVRVTVDVEM